MLSTLKIPPPLCPRPAVRKNHRLVSQQFSLHYFFFAQNWVFMAVVDVGQRFRHAGVPKYFKAAQPKPELGHGTGLLMAVHKNQPLLPKHFLA